MQEQEYQQLFEILNKTQKPLIVLPKNPNGDALGSALAFFSFFKKINKIPDIVSETDIFSNYEFLPYFYEIKKNSALEKDFVINVDVSRVKLEELSYHSDGDKVKIFLKPSGGNFKAEEMSFGSGTPDYDLVVCLDIPSLEHLGDVYTKNAEMFFGATKINIDNNINNENYGNINIVDITASSTAELIMELFKKYSEQNNVQLIDPEIATALLTGIIYETNCFQNNKTTPDSFSRASELISMGADQQEIIRYLYKTKHISMLKFLGRAMARIRSLPEPGIFYTTVSALDVEKTGASGADMLQAMNELVSNMSEVKMLFLIIEREKSLLAYIYSTPNIKLSEIVNYFGGEVISDSLGKVTFNEHLDKSEILVKSALEQLKVRLGF